MGRFLWQQPLATCSTLPLLQSRLVVSKGMQQTEVYNMHHSELPGVARTVSTCSATHANVAGAS